MLNLHDSTHWEINNSSTILQQLCYLLAVMAPLDNPMISITLASKFNETFKNHKNFNKIFPKWGQNIGGYQVYWTIDQQK